MEGLGQRQHDFLRPGDVAGALDWWRDAGVDLDFVESPQPWLAAPEPEAPPTREFKAAATYEPQPAPLAMIGGDPALWPRDLAAFRQWWLDEPSLDDGAVRGRVAPRGEAGAALMIVLGQPETESGDDLVGEAAGRMLAAMLKAMQVAPEETYLASALPRPMPVPDWGDLGRRGLAEVLRHHIALARPQRVLVFGEGVLSLLGHDPAQNAQNSLQLYQQDRTIGVLGARDLALLGRRPAWRARFWRDCLDWTGSETA